MGPRSAVVAVYIFFALILGSTPVRAELSTCQKAYFMIRQCAAELMASNSPKSGCCPLIAAFDARGCLTVDDRLKTLGDALSWPLKKLHDACYFEESDDLIMVPYTDVAATATTNKGDAKVEKIMAQEFNNEGSAFLKDVLSVAETVLNTDIKEKSSIVLEVGIQGNDPTGLAPAAVATTNNAVKRAQTYASKNGLIVDQIEVYVESEERNPGAMCACVGYELSEKSGWYFTFRLRLCQFFCGHTLILAGTMLIQSLFLSLYGIILLVRCHDATGGTPTGAITTRGRTRHPLQKRRSVSRTPTLDMVREEEEGCDLEAQLLEDGDSDGSN